ncbi:MAG: PKD domain-containing protein [Bacteroidota bacterium]
MKMNIDKSFKKSLEGHEMPFDSKAWEAMNKRLDQSMPSNGSANWKWFFGGAAILITVAITVAMLSRVKTSDSKNKKAELSAETLQKDQNTAPTQQPTSENTLGDKNLRHRDEQSTTDKSDASKQQAGNDQMEQVFQSRKSDNASNKVDNQSVNHINNPERSNVSESNERPAKLHEVILPILENSCLGETVKIDNRNNDINIYVIDPSDNRTVIKAGSKSSVVLNEEGIYSVVHMENGQIVKKESFLSLSSPRVDIAYDRDLLFEQGVPTTNLTTSAVGASYEWSFPSINQGANGRNVAAHFFKDGQHEVKLKVTGSNGCSTTEIVKIEIDNKYNLLAESGFNPNSAIAVNREFMPDALVLRNTPFTLYIIEPSTGAVIYETSDASQPWTGVDKRTGQMVEVNATFVWTVLLKNPMEGEKSNYAGTIVLSSNR